MQLLANTLNYLISVLKWYFPQIFRPKIAMEKCTGGAPSSVRVSECGGVCAACMARGVSSGKYRFLEAAIT